MLSQTVFFPWEFQQSDKYVTLSHSFWKEENHCIFCNISQKYPCDARGLYIQKQVETNSQIPVILKLPEAILACLHFQTKLPAKQAGRANSLLMDIVSSLKLMPFLFSLPIF